MLFAVHFIFPETSAWYTLLIQTQAEGLGGRHTGAKLKTGEGSARESNAVHEVSAGMV